MYRRLEEDSMDSLLQEMDQSEAGFGAEGSEDSLDEAIDEAFDEAVQETLTRRSLPTRSGVARTLCLQRLPIPARQTQRGRPLIGPPADRTIQRTVYGWGQYRRSIEDLPPDQQAVLKSVGDAIIASYRQGGQPIRTVSVYGHADWDTPRNLQREQQMSDERARMVTNWLKAYVGISISAQIIWDTRGFGATQLKASPTTEANRRKNRRVEIYVGRASGRNGSTVIIFDSAQGRYFMSGPPAGGRYNHAPTGSRIALARAQMADESVFGRDDRVLVTNTLLSPHRFICWILPFFGNDPDDPRRPYFGLGLSGVLISPRYVLTVGHGLYGWLIGSNKKRAERRWALAVEVVPGFNGLGQGSLNREPFGRYRGAAWRVSKRYEQFINSNRSSRWNACCDSDYGLITLDRPIFTNCGFWGGVPRTMPLRAVQAAELRNNILTLCGYPADKCLDQPPTGSITKQQRDTCGCLERAAKDPTCPDSTAKTCPYQACTSPRIGSTQWMAEGPVLRIQSSDLGPGAIEHGIDMMPGPIGVPNLAD